jgi:hypothetical protein
MLSLTKDASGEGRTFRRKVWIHIAERYLGTVSIQGVLDSFPEILPFPIHVSESLDIKLH